MQKSEFFEIVSQEVEQVELANSFNYVKRIITKALDKICTDNKFSPKFSVYMHGASQNGVSVVDYDDLEIVVLIQKTEEETARELVVTKKVFSREVDYQAAYSLTQFKTELFNTIEELTREDYKTDDVNEILSQKAKLHMNTKSIFLPSSMKCILNVHILPAFSFKDAILIYDSQLSSYVVSFPKLHTANLNNKDARTDGNFKKIVRATRYIKNLLVEHQIIDRGFAPSYFIDCLLYNVPDKLFIDGDLIQIFIRVQNYLLNCDLSNFVCAHSQFYMFNNGTDGWEFKKAKDFISLLIEFYQTIE